MNKYSIYFLLERQLKSMGIKEERSELINAFTRGKKQRLTSLSSTEYFIFLKWIKTTFDLTNSMPYQHSRENKIRRKIYALFIHKMNYSPSELELWCTKYGKFNKKINAHSYKELCILASQAERCYNSFINEINHDL